MQGVRQLLVESKEFHSLLEASSGESVDDVQVQFFLIQNKWDSHSIKYQKVPAIYPYWTCTLSIPNHGLSLTWKLFESPDRQGINLCAGLCTANMLRTDDGIMFNAMLQALWIQLNRESWQCFHNGSFYKNNQTYSVQYLGIPKKCIMV